MPPTNAENIVIGFTSSVSTARVYLDHVFAEVILEERTDCMKSIIEIVERFEALKSVCEKVMEDESLMEEHEIKIFVDHATASTDQRRKLETERLLNVLEIQTSEQDKKSPDELLIRAIPRRNRPAVISRDSLKTFRAFVQMIKDQGKLDTLWASDGPLVPHLDEQKGKDRGKITLGAINNALRVLQVGEESLSIEMGRGNDEMRKSVGESLYFAPEASSPISRNTTPREIQVLDSSEAGGEDIHTYDTDQNSSHFNAEGSPGSSMKKRSGDELNQPGKKQKILGLPVREGPDAVSDHNDLEDGEWFTGTTIYELMQAIAANKADKFGVLDPLLFQERTKRPRQCLPQSHLLMAVHSNGNHWLLANLDKDKALVHLYDSLRPTPSNVIGQIKIFFKCYCNWDKLPRIVEASVPQQRNSDDCGPRTVEATRCIISDIDPSLHMLFVDISVLRREYYGALKSKSLSLITLSSEYLQSVCSSFEQQHQQMVRAHFKDLAGKISEGQKHWEDYQKVVQTISDSKDWVRRGRECYQGVPDLKGSNSGHKVEAGRKATEEAVTAVENHMHEMEQVARNMKSLMWHKPEELASHLSNLPLRGAPTEEYELLVKKILEAIIPA